MALGLGKKVLNEINKLIYNIITPERKQKIILELGDTMWYLQGICNRLECSIETILHANMTKLA
jgi:hypothetical protein